MAHNLFLLRAIFLLICFVAFHGSSCSQEDYWKMKLPKVPIPKAVMDNLVHSDENWKPTTNQPYTVFSWKYKEDKEKEKSATNQPYTVFSWKYKEDKEKEKPTTKQPFTVFSWKYKEDKEKEKPTTNQPFTVFSWKYREDKEKPMINYKEDKEKEKPTTNQPFTVFSWKYREDKEKPMINYKEDNEKEMPIANQPYTVFSWKYKGDEEKETPTTNHPYTVDGWKYKEDEDKPMINYKQDKEKEMPIANQPYTVFSWKYKEDEENEKPTIAQPYTSVDDSNTNNHKLHDHLMHHMGSVDDRNTLTPRSEQNQDKDLIGGSVFFIEEKLRVGMKQRHDFQKIEKVSFLPKDMADTIPFAVDRLPEVLNRLSINPDSVEATSMKETLTTCLERPRVKKENRTCAQSLEDIVDFVIRELGSDNVKVRMMSMPEDEVPIGMHEFEITKVDKLEVPGKNGVACHKMVYPYAVYWCHHQQDIGQYAVTLISPKGVKVETTAVCHYDTYAWDPNVLALRYLKIRPGDAPICHFSGFNDMFWSLNTALQGEVGRSGNRKLDLVQ